jgi:hypothetical protein
VAGATVAFDNVNGSVFAPPPTHPVTVSVCAADIPGWDVREPGGTCADAETAQVSAAAQKSSIFMSASYAPSAKGRPQGEMGELVNW